MDTVDPFDERAGILIRPKSDNLTLVPRVTPDKPLRL
jgi:hypothetical protein